MLFTVAKRWNQPKCPLRDKQVSKYGIYLRWEYYPALKRRRFWHMLQHKWTLKDIMLRVILQFIMRNIYFIFILVLRTVSKILWNFPSDWVAKLQPLYPGTELNIRNRVLGEVEKKQLYYFARQKGPQQANALKTVPQSGGDRDSYSNGAKRRGGSVHGHSSDWLVVMQLEVSILNLWF